MNIYIGAYTLFSQEFDGKKNPRVLQMYLGMYVVFKVCLYTSTNPENLGFIWVMSSTVISTYLDVLWWTGARHEQVSPPPRSARLDISADSAAAIKQQ